MPELGPTGRQLGRRLEVFDGGFGVAEPVAAEASQALVKALLLLVVAALQDVLPVLAQRLPLAGAFEEPLEATRCPRAVVGIRGSRGELPVDFGGFRRPFERLLENHGPLQGEAVARRGVGVRRHLLGEEVGKPRGVARGAQAAFEALAGGVALGVHGEDGAEGGRRLLEAAQVLQQDAGVSQGQLLGLGGVEGVGAGALREALGELFVARRALQQRLETLLDIAGCSLAVRQAHERVDRSRQVAQAFFQKPRQLVQAGGAPGRGQQLGEPLPGLRELLRSAGGLELLDQRLESLDVGRVGLERSPIGGDRLFAAPVSYVQPGHPAAVRGLLAALQQRVEPLEERHQLGVVAELLVESGADAQRLGVLRSRRDPVLRPLECLLRLVAALEDAREFPDQEGDPRALGGDGRLVLVGLEDRVFVAFLGRQSLAAPVGGAAGAVESQGGLEGAGRAFSVLEALEQKPAELAQVRGALFAGTAAPQLLEQLPQRVPGLGLPVDSLEGGRDVGREPGLPAWPARRQSGRSRYRPAAARAPRRARRARSRTWSDRWPRAPRAARGSRPDPRGVRAAPGSRKEPRRPARPRARARARAGARPRASWSSPASD